MNPESFIATTDYATLKNDNFGIIQVTFPGGQFFTPGEEKIVTQSIELGTRNASVRSRIASNQSGNRFYACSSLSCNRTGWTDGAPPPPVGYTILGTLVRTSPTTLEARVSVWNPYVGNLAIPAIDEVFTFEVSTFLSPFVS